MLDSTEPSTEISGGLGSEPMFCSFVFGQEILSPRCVAESLKLSSDVVASVLMEGARQCCPQKLDQ